MNWRKKFHVIHLLSESQAHHLLFLKPCFLGFKLMIARGKVLIQILKAATSENRKIVQCLTGLQDSSEC